MSASIPASNPATDKAALECKHPGLLMFAVILVSIIQLLDLTIANVALPHMQSSLGASFNNISWVLTSYIIAGVMITPVVGWLSDKVGSRPLFLGAVTTFLLASMLCGAATSLTEMVIFRSIQGICAAFIGPMSQTILLDTNIPSKQASALSIWGLVVMIAPISGPMLGGLLTESMNWRWVFYINLPIGIPALLLLFWLLPTRPMHERKLDKFGFFYLAVGLGALQLMLDRGQHENWFESTEIIIELMIAGCAFWLFFTHTLNSKNPLFPKELFKNANFVSAFGFMFMLGFANVAIVSILPSMYQNVFGYSAFDTGLLLLPRGLGVVLTMYISSQIMKRVDIRYMLVTGFMIASVAMWFMSHWSLEMDRWPIITTGFVQGFGLGLVFMPMNIAAFATMAPALRQDGSSLMNLLRNIGGSFGISATFTLIARNAQISHADMASNVTNYTLPSVELSSLADRLGNSGAAVLQFIDAEINRQAMMIAYLDLFYVTSMVICAIALSALLLKPLRIH